MKENTGVEMTAFRAVGRKSIKYCYEQLAHGRVFDISGLAVGYYVQWGWDPLRSKCDVGTMFSWVGIHSTVSVMLGWDPLHSSVMLGWDPFHSSVMLEICSAGLGSTPQ